MLEVDLGAIPCWSQASTTAHCNGLQPSFKTGFWSNSQIWTNKCSGNDVMIERISDCLEDEDRALINVQSGNVKAKAMESEGCEYLESLDD